MLEPEKLKEKALKLGVMLDNEQLKKFKKYYELLVKFNEHTNLVSSADAETVLTKHFLDSLAFGLAANEIDLNQSLNIIDIGSGGGFPGIPLIIAFKNWKLTAVDSVAKKLEFTKQLGEELGLSKRIETQPIRAEELARKPDKREFYDVGVVRAVAKLNVIAEYCLPLVKQGGYFVAYKAKTAEEELKDAKKALSELGGEYQSTISYTLSGDQERNLIIVKKSSKTPDKYPRRTGIPTKRPIV